MLPTWMIVGFTGHRNIDDPKLVAHGICVALDRLIAKHGSLAAISSVAQGSDSLFVEEVAKRKLPFLLVLPFTKARFQEDFQPADWQHVEPLIAQGIYVEEVGNTGSDEEAYMETGIRIADRADIMIAVWDGKPSAGFGGTGDVVNYCRQLAKPLIWINSATGAMIEERLESLPRTQSNVPWRGDSHQIIIKYFHELDEVASLRGPKVRHLIQRIILLNLLASSAGLTVLALGIRGLGGHAITFLEVAALVSAFILTVMHHRRHVEWMTSRIEAEICRSFLAIWPMRIQADYSPKLAIRGFDRLIRNLRFIQLLDRTPSPPFETARNEYLENRVQNQIEYFRQQNKKAGQAYRRLKGLAMTSAAAAALMAVSHFVLSNFGVKGPAYTISEALSLVLPLVSTALFSLILTHEFSRRTVRYGEMVSILNDAAQRLQAARTWNGLIRIAIEIESELLQEVIEWHSFRRFASEPH
jgi:hypothetical protein